MKKIYGIFRMRADFEDLSNEMPLAIMQLF